MKFEKVPANKYTPVPPTIIAYNMAYEARVLHRDENDQLEPDAYERFERFWETVERELIPTYVDADRLARRGGDTAGPRIYMRIDGGLLARSIMDSASRPTEQPPQHEPDHRAEDAAQQAADQHGMTVPDGFLNVFPVVLFFAGLLIGAALALLFKVA